MLEKWGLGPDRLQEINPKLVMLRVTGFGQTGPYASRRAFGTLAEAMSGFAHQTGEEFGPPTLPPFGLADGVAGIKRFVLDSIVGAGGKPCPPGIVGVGIGGSADYAMYLAKEAIARPVGTRNSDPEVAKLEEELFELLNETGIGPMGLGGDVTVLNCHIEHADTHMTLNPVAVNYQCWAARRATAHFAADGTVEFDREF